MGAARTGRAEVKFLTWTDDNLLRQVVYEGLREDKPAADQMHYREEFVADETTLQLFWMRWPQLSEWAGSLWRLLSEELAGPSAPHDESELFEIGESG